MDLSFCQLDRGFRPCNLQVVQARHCTLMRFDVGNRVHHLLPPAQGYRTFGLLAHEQAPSTLGDGRFEDDALLQIDPDRGLDATIESGFSGFTFAVNERRLAETAALLGVRRESALQSHTGVTKPMPAAYLRHLRRRLPVVIRQALAAPDDAAVVAFFDEELPALLVRGWCIGTPHATRTARLSTRSRAFQRAAEAIRCESIEIRTIEQLCRVSASATAHWNAPSARTPASPPNAIYPRHASRACAAICSGMANNPSPSWRIAGDSPT